MQVQEAKGGCCGLAGSWGFEQGKHDISMQCGEVGLLPAVRNAEPDTLIVADGFSCKTQLEQSGLDRRALHTAEVIKLARDYAARGVVPGARPERLAASPPAPPLAARVARSALAIAVGAGVVGITGYLARAVFRRAFGHSHGRARLAASSEAPAPRAPDEMELAPAR
jgi:hypothetical protein